MPIDEAIAALLHLSAFVAAFAMAFVGIDHPSKGENEIDEIIREAIKGSSDVSHVILKLGLRPDVGLSRRNFRYLSVIFPAGVICYAAGQPLRFGVLAPAFFLYRQTYLPFFGLLRSRAYIVIVSSMALFALCIFLGLVGGNIWGTNAYDEAATVWRMKVIFASYVFIIFFILSLGSAVVRLRSGALATMVARAAYLVETRMSQDLERMKRSVEAARSAIEDAKNRRK